MMTFDLVARDPGAQADDPVAAGIGREFRTPLNAVIGLAEALMCDDLEPPTPRQTQALTAIRSAGLRLLGLVETEIDAGDPPSTSATALIEVVDVGRAAHRLHDTVRDRLAEFDVRLLEPCSGPGVEAAADRTLVRQALYAMVAHILNDCRAGAEVGVTVRRGRDFVEVAVAARQPKTPHRATGDVRPFMPRGVSRGRPLGGPGLNEARRQALTMNGRIEWGRLHGDDRADYAPGLVLLLPPAAPPSTARRMASVARRPVVLYVEDQAANIMLMRRVLAGLGDFDLYVGETGPIGVAMARSIRPDVILLDINLPGFDGFHVKAALAEDAVVRAIPVIAFTADATALDRRKGSEAGFVDYLTKPLDITALATALNRVLGEGAAVRRRPSSPGRLPADRPSAPESRRSPA